MWIALDILLVLAFCLMMYIAVFGTIGMANQIERQRRMAIEMYCRAYWKAEGVSAQEACELWTRFRDTFQIPEGTATAGGVGDTYSKP